MREILDAQLPPRPARVNPRVVKKPRSKFPAKKRHHLNQGTQRKICQAVSPTRVSMCFPNEVVRNYLEVACCLWNST